MGGDLRAVSDADVRADLARVLGLPARRTRVNAGREIDAVELSAMLRQACKEAGGQGAFAARMGVARSFISMVMHAKRVPTPEILAALGLRKIVTVRYVRVGNGTP